VRQPRLPARRQVYAELLEVPPQHAAHQQRLAVQAAATAASLLLLPLLCCGGAVCDIWSAVKPSTQGSCQNDAVYTATVRRRAKDAWERQAMRRHRVMGVELPAAATSSVGCDAASALSRGVYMRPSMFSCCTKPAMRSRSTIWQA